MTTYDHIRLLYGLGPQGQPVLDKPAYSLPGCIRVYSQLRHGKAITSEDAWPNLVQLAAALQHLNPGLRLKSAVGFAHWIAGACERQQSIIAMHGLAMALSHCDSQDS